MWTCDFFIAIKCGNFKSINTDQHPHSSMYIILFATAHLGKHSHDIVIWYEYRITNTRQHGPALGMCIPKRYVTLFDKYDVLNPPWVEWINNYWNYNIFSFMMIFYQEHFIDLDFIAMGLLRVPWLYVWDPRILPLLAISQLRHAVVLRNCRLKFSYVLECIGYFFRLWMCFRIFISCPKISKIYH